LRGRSALENGVSTARCADNRKARARISHLHDLGRLDDSQPIRGTVVTMFTGVKVFSATTPTPRNELGAVVTAWIHANPSINVVDMVVAQSSDAAFHCFTIAVFYR
jgi:hypothetical protein